MALNLIADKNSTFLSDFLTVYLQISCEKQVEKLLTRRSRLLLHANTIEELEMPGLFQVLLGISIMKRGLASLQTARPRKSAQPLDLSCARTFSGVSASISSYGHSDHKTSVKSDGLPENNK